MIMLGPRLLGRVDIEASCAAEIVAVILPCDSEERQNYHDHKQNWVPEMVFDNNNKLRVLPWTIPGISTLRGDVSGIMTASPAVAAAFANPDFIVKFSSVQVSPESQKRAGTWLECGITRKNVKTTKS